MLPGTTAQRGDRYLMIAAAVLTFFAFLPAVRNDFLNWDDVTNFALNPGYRGLGWEQLKWMWTTGLMGRYIPVTWMTLGLDYKIWGMNPFGYHLTSILFHTVNAVLFYLLALAILAAANPKTPERQAAIQYGALFAALLFAVHPLRIESVAWATERRDVVCGMFFLLSLLAYVRGAGDTPSTGIQRRYYFASLGFFVLAVLSKEMAVTLPLVLLVLDWYPLGRLKGKPWQWLGKPFGTVWIEKTPFLAISLADGILALLIGARHAISVAPAGFGWAPRIGESIYSLAFYVWKTVAPIHLAPFYSFTPEKVDPSRLPLAASIAFVVLITGAAIVLRRRFPSLLAVWLSYAIMLAPVTGIIYNGLEITADRYSYLPCLGWALLAGGFMVAWTVQRPRAKPFVLATAAGAIMLLGVLSRIQVQVWRNSETLWTYALATEPSYLANTSLGTVLMERGDYLWAREHFERAIAMKSDYWLAHFNLASCLGSLGRWHEAAAEYRITLGLPGLGHSEPDVQDAFGYALMMDGQLDEAIRHFNRALELRPDYADAQRNLALALLKKGTP